MKIGRALRPLRSKGVLILASGQATHNLRTMRASVPRGPERPWVTRFRAWLDGTVGAEEESDRWERVRRWEEAPDARRCVPRTPCARARARLR